LLSLLLGEEVEDAEEEVDEVQVQADRRQHILIRLELSSPNVHSPHTHTHHHHMIMVSTHDTTIIIVKETKKGN
jgi:hypothetical protein